MGNVDNNIVNVLTAVADRGDVGAEVDCFTDDGRWVTAEGMEPGATFPKAEMDKLLSAMFTARVGLAEAGVTWSFSEPTWMGETGGLVSYEINDAQGHVLEKGVDVFHIRDGKIHLKDSYRKSQESTFSGLVKQDLNRELNVTS